MTASGATGGAGGCGVGDAGNGVCGAGFAGGDGVGIDGAGIVGMDAGEDVAGNGGGITVRAPSGDGVGADGVGATGAGGEGAVGGEALDALISTATSFISCIMRSYPSEMESREVPMRSSAARAMLE